MLFGLKLFSKSWLNLLNIKLWQETIKYGNQAQQVGGIGNVRTEAQVEQRVQEAKQEVKVNRIAVVADLFSLLLRLVEKLFEVMFPHLRFMI